MENQLQRFDNNGLELIINTQTGEVHASQSALARMVEVSETSIRKFVTSNQIDTLKAEIPTQTGFKTSNLLDEEAIYKIFSKYKPELLIQCAKAGIRVYLHQLAGYEVSSTATKPKELTPLDILEQQVKWMRHTEAELHKAQLEIQELKEFKAEIRQTQQEAIAHLKHLDPPTLTAAPLCTKEKLNRLIRDYSLVNKLSFSYVYNWVYREFRDRYHIDLKVRGKNHKPKLTGTEYADRYDLIEKLYATCSEVLI